MKMITILLSALVLTACTGNSGGGSSSDKDISGRQLMEKLLKDDTTAYACESKTKKDVVFWMEYDELNGEYYLFAGKGNKSLEFSFENVDTTGQELETGYTYLETSPENNDIMTFVTSSYYESYTEGEFYQFYAKIHVTTETEAHLEVHWVKQDGSTESEKAIQLVNCQFNLI